MITEQKESLLSFDGHFFPSSELSSLQQQEIYDEMLKKEKEFASEIYIQRLKEKYL